MTTVRAAAATPRARFVRESIERRAGQFTVSAGRGGARSAVAHHDVEDLLALLSQRLRHLVVDGSGAVLDGFSLGVGKHIDVGALFLEPHAGRGLSLREWPDRSGG